MGENGVVGSDFWPLSVGLARKAVYDLIGYCHIMVIDLLVTYQSSRLSLLTPPSQHFDVVFCSHTLNRFISSALKPSLLNWVHYA